MDQVPSKPVPEYSVLKPASFLLKVLGLLAGAGGAIVTIGGIAELVSGKYTLIFTAAACFLYCVLLLAFGAALDAIRDTALNSWRQVQLLEAMRGGQGGPS